MSLVLLAVLFFLVDREALLNALTTINPAYYLIGLGAFMSAVCFWTLRWWMFIRAAEEPVSFSKALTTLLTGIFYSMFLPTFVGIDIGRMYELGRDQNNRKTHVVSTVLLDRLMGLISLVIMAFIALIIGYQYTSGDDGVIITVIGALAGLVVGWLLFFNRRFMEFIFKLVFSLPLVNRLEETIREIYEALYLLHKQPRLLLATGAVSMLNNIAETMSVVFIAVALGVEVSPVYFFLFMPIIWLVMLIPISISGLGLREGAFVFFFTQVGVSAADAVAISLLFYSYSVIVGVLGGVTMLKTSVSDAFQRRAVMPEGR